MKHQYFGDINDYRKYGLIRALTNSGELKTGVCWMLTPDTDGNVDGRKLSYLDNPQVHRYHDPQLFDLLHGQVKVFDLRSVSAPAMSAILPHAFLYDVLVPAGVEARKAWLRDFLNDASSELLFFDPDNGMEVSSVGKGRKDSPKYLYWDELAEAYQAGKSVLVYQHFQRVNRKEFIECLTRKAVDLTGASTVMTYTTPHVVFLLLVQERHLPMVLRANEVIWQKWRSQIVISSETSDACISTCDSSCPFCQPKRGRIVIENRHAYATYDVFPVTLGHSLIIPKRHVSSFFDTTSEEQSAMLELLTQMREILSNAHSPDGFNIGINDGAAAGQTVMHLHIHLIPRYRNDTEDPRGGVRWIMPEKAPYWKKHE